MPGHVTRCHASRMRSGASATALRLSRSSRAPSAGRNRSTVGRLVKWTGIICHRVVDVILIDLVLVNGVALAVSFGGTVLRQFQSGNLQRYAVYVIIGLGFILLLL